MKHSGIPWIGEIPQSWRVLRTKNIFSVGKDIVGHDSSSTQLLSLTTKGVKRVQIGTTSGKVPDSYDTYQVVHKNNLVMCLFDLDCSAVFSGLSSFEGMISPAYKVLSVNDGYYPKFYDYWFSYIFDGRKYKYLSKNIRYSLTYDEFSSLGIVAPSLSEQKEIAEFLDIKCAEIDAMIVLQESIIDELGGYRQALITEAVSHGIRANRSFKDTHVNWIGNIPTDWVLAQFGRFATIKCNLVNPEEYPDYPQIAPDSIEKGSARLIGKIRTVKESNIISGNHLFFKGQIVYSKIRPLLNKVIIAPFDGLCSADMYPIETKEDKRFFTYLMLSSYFLEQIKQVTEDRVKMPKVNQEELSSFLVVMPSLDEQIEIADYLDKKCTEIDKLIALKQSKLESLRTYKKSLIYEYVTGKKRVLV